MQVREIVVTAGRTFNHPYESYSNLRPEVQMTATLEAVESGISEFESEFLANIVNPFSNKTVYEEAAPQLAMSYDKKPKPFLLTSEDK